MAIRKSEKTYLISLLELNSLFFEQLSSLMDRGYPSRCPLDLLKCLVSSSNILSNRIQALISLSNDPDTDIEDILSEASDIYDFVEYFQSYVLPIIRSSDNQSVPAEFIRPLERIASLIFPNSKLIISSVPENNYYFSEISPKIKEIFSSLKLESVLVEHQLDITDLFHLQLSSNPPCNILSHCLLGHEIGHAIYLKNNVENVFSPLIKFDETVIKKTANAILESFGRELAAAGLPQQLNLQQTLAYIEYITRIQLPIIASSWAEELFSDIIGAGLFGPAFICSLSLLLLPFEDIDIGNESHPPSRFRVQSCLNAINRNDPGFGYRNLARHHKDDEYNILVKPWSEAVGNVFHWPSNDEVQRAVFRAIIGLKSQIIREAKNQLGDNLFTYDAFEHEVPLLRNRLLDWLPPNEYQDSIGTEFNTATIRAIFNAGWLSYLEDIGTMLKIFPEFTELEIRRKYYQLLRKGVDLAEIHRRWKEVN